MDSPLRTSLPDDVRELLADERRNPRPYQLPLDEARRLSRAAPEAETAEPADRLGFSGAVRDYRIPGPEEAVPVRIYTPDADGPVPVIVWYHGGGFVVGSLRSNDYRCRSLAEAARCSIVSVGYRRAPEHPFPAPLLDCYAAAEWVAEHPELVDGTPDRIAVGGTSAGGNLAAAVALLARDREGPPLSHQLILVACLDPAMDTPAYEENASGYGLSRAGMEYYWDQYLQPDLHAANPYAAPIVAPDLAGLPPAVVATAGFDPLRDEGIAYAERLDEAGVPVDHLHYPALPHHIPKLAEHGLRPGVEAFDEIARTIREHLTE